MHKKIIIGIAVAAAMLISSLALYAQLSAVSISNVHSCIEETVTWTETEPAYEYVTFEKPTYGQVWSEENQTYEQGITGTEQYQVLQQRGEKTTQKTKTVCTQDTSYATLNTGFKTVPIAAGKYGFFCSNTEKQIVCDNKKDGNSDGICKPGESCAVFDIQDSKIRLTYTNGGDRLLCYPREVKGVPFEVCYDNLVDTTSFLEVR